MVTFSGLKWQDGILFLPVVIKILQYDNIALHAPHNLDAGKNQFDVLGCWFSCLPKGVLVRV